MPYTVAIIGLGKIAEDQHLPVIAKNKDFKLAAIVSQRGLSRPGIPTFPMVTELLAKMPALDAVAICTPPRPRYAIAREALAAGKHVLLEKPSTATLSELANLAKDATQRKRVLFTTWHSQFNPAVDEAQRRLAGASIRSLHVEWKEDVRRWHPGQEWIWAPGGFGVFDPGINALSIVTKIMPSPIFIDSADLHIPENCATPIAASLVFRSADPAESKLTAEFDWRQEGDQTWTITIKTASGQVFSLEKGGSRLLIDGKLITESQPAEYEAIYERFGELLKRGESDVDPAPFRLVADAFLMGRWHEVAAFHEK
jgi:D-galactose 1-dehydrogenase